MSKESSTAALQGRQARQGVRINWTDIAGKLGLLAVVVLLGLIMTFLSPVFLSWTNLTNLLLQSTILMTLAIGQTFVIMTRGIDLSIGGVMAFSSSLGLGLMVSNGLDPISGTLITLLVGVFFGVFNGVAVTRFTITPLIVTLATLGIARGAVFIYTNGANITPVPDLYETIGTGRFLGLPWAVVIVLLLAIVAHIVLSRTVFGRSVYATGGNELAARLAGVRTNLIIVAAYAISGLSAAIAGILLTARLESAGPRAGVGIELTVIAAAVIGGTSLFGGQGNIAGTLLGVILISLVTNAVNLLRVPPAWDDLVKGIVIFLAALVDVYRRKMMVTSARVTKKP
ncbi:MAG TPA: ABC transporter permease [Chthoniobacterales bacterium]